MKTLILAVLLAGTVFGQDEDLDLDLDFSDYGVTYKPSVPVYTPYSPLITAPVRNYLLRDIRNALREQTDVMERQNRLLWQSIITPTYTAPVYAPPKIRYPKSLNCITTPYLTQCF